MKEVSMHIQLCKYLSSPKMYLIETNLIISFFIISASLLSCSKKNNCFTPPSPVLIRLLSQNGTDLLKPVNPGAYQANDLLFTYTDNNGVKQSAVSIHSFPNTDTFFLSTDIGWYADKGRTFLLKLSATDTDTVYLRNDEVDEDGCHFFRFVEFKYNNVPYSLKGMVAGMPPVFEIKK